MSISKGIIHMNQIKEVAVFGRDLVASVEKVSEKEFRVKVLSRGGFGLEPSELPFYSTDKYANEHFSKMYPNSIFETNYNVKGRFFGLFQEFRLVSVHGPGQTDHPDSRDALLKEKGL